ncbi:MAG: hypothetical protein ACE5JB_13795 [bacterium]
MTPTTLEMEAHDDTALGLMEDKAVAQNSPQIYIELRAADSETGFYRYAEFNYAIRIGAVVDIVYFGVPGQNELYIGMGYQFPVTATLTVTPLLYGVVGKENGERGVALGTFVLGTVREWSVYSFLGYFEPIEGNVPRYIFLDSLDLSRRIKQWEVGASTGFFYSSGQWSYLVGPVIIRNDEWGAWRFCVRAGLTVEIRAARTFNF